MARGGIYDQLGGGFARYSVDAGWVVPHFEKMLYDNALLLGVYAHWWRLTGDPLAERVVAETVDWLLTEMRTEQGGFAASLDADSVDEHGHLTEGAFYAWIPAQLVDGARRGGRGVGGGGLRGHRRGHVRARALHAAAARRPRAGAAGPGYGPASRRPATGAPGRAGTTRWWRPGTAG